MPRRSATISPGSASPPDEEHRQSLRFDRYEAALERLRAAGRVYPAYESAQELDLKRKVQLGRGKPPVYDRAALALTDADRARLEAEGRRPHWRFRLDHDAADRVGRSDPRPPASRSGLAQRSGDPARGRQLALHAAEQRRRYRHGRDPCRARRGSCHQHRRCRSRCSRRSARAARPSRTRPCWSDRRASSSKRLGSLGVEAMREAGIEPIALVAKLARIGTSLPVEPVADAEPLIDSVRFRDLRPRAGAVRPGRAGGAQRPHRPPARRSPRSATGCRPAWPRPTGRRSGPNLSSVAEAADWWEILHGHVERRGGRPRIASS